MSATPIAHATYFFDAYAMPPPRHAAAADFTSAISPSAITLKRYLPLFAYARCFRLRVSLFLIFSSAAGCSLFFFHAMMLFPDRR